MYLSMIFTRDSPGDQDIPDVKSINALLLPTGPASQSTARLSLSKKALTVVFFPLLIFGMMSLPNNWQYLSLFYIRSEQQTEEVAEYGTCWQWEVSDYLILKLYPDIVIYYSFIYVVTAVGLLAQVYPNLRRILHTRVFYSLPLGEVLATVAVVLVVVGEFCYWYYYQWWQSTPRKDYTSEEMAARSMGQIGKY